MLFSRFFIYLVAWSHDCVVPDERSVAADTSTKVSDLQRTTVPNINDSHIWRHNTCVLRNHSRYTGVFHLSRIDCRTPLPNHWQMLVLFIYSRLLVHSRDRKTSGRWWKAFLPKFCTVKDRRSVATSVLMPLIFSCLWSDIQYSMNQNLFPGPD